MKSTPCEDEKIFDGCIVGRVNPAVLGENIRRLRKRPGLNIKAGALAERMGALKSGVSAWENWDRDTLPETETLLRLAKALQVTIDDLLIGVDDDYDRLRHDLGWQPTRDTNPPSQTQGGVDVLPAPTRVFQGWREELLPEVLDAVGQLADVIARSRTTDPEAPPARSGPAKRRAGHRTAR